MTRTHRLPSSLSLLTLVTAAAGCVPYVAVQSAPPPLASYRSFIVEPMRFEQLNVGSKSEPEYLSGKSPEARASWEGDKAALAQQFLSSLMSQAGALQIGPAMQAPGPGTLIVRPWCQLIEPGHFNGFINIDTQVRVTAQILDPSGRVLDSVDVIEVSPARMSNPSSGGRIRETAFGLGARVAHHLHRETGV
jgi:hypothetical protein